MAGYKLEEGLIGLDWPETVVNGVQFQSKGCLCGIDQFRGLLGCRILSWLPFGCWLGGGVSGDITFC